MSTNLATRIKSIQKQLSVSQTGVVDDATCSAFELLMSITRDSSVLKNRIKAIQKALGTGADGIPGPATATQMENYLKDRLPVVIPSSLTVRIKNIQKDLGVFPTGVIDDASCAAFEKLMSIVSDSSLLKNRIKGIQKALGVTADGIVGPGTTTRMESYLSNKLPKTPAGATMVVSRKGIDALIEFEISSKEYYNKAYQQPIWPGGHSGVTIGIGYDIGFATKADFTATWDPYISASALTQLQEVCGKSGAGCKALIAGLKSVKIPYDIAAIVFYQFTLPIYAARTKKIYPGIEKLPPDAQAALLSLVYNRGSSLSGDSRKEMKNIAAHVAKGDLAAIAKEIRNMKRLWDPKKLKGLITRREAEAVLVENATFNILPEQLVMV